MERILRYSQSSHLERGLAENWLSTNQLMRRDGLVDDNHAVTLQSLGAELPRSSEGHKTDYWVEDAFDLLRKALLSGAFGGF